MLSKIKEVKHILFLMPTLTVFSVFMFWPMAYTFYLSFFNWNMIRPTRTFVGFDNYIQIFTSASTVRVLGNTGLYILILLVFNLIMPYILAFVLNTVITRFKNLFKPLFFLPSVLSLVVATMVYAWILNPISGPLSIVFSMIGIDMPFWSSRQGWVIAGISLITSWRMFGFNFIVILGGISGVPDEVIESTRLDKIPLHKVFLNIVVPMSSAVGVYVFIMTIVQGLQFVFIPIRLLTHGGPDGHSSNLVYQSFHEAFVVFDTGQASALAVLTVLLFAFLLWLQFKFVEKGAYYEN